MDGGTLTPYEAGQVERIAAWKGHKPGLLARFTEVLTWPLDRVMARILPGDRAVHMFERLNESARWEIGHEVIRREAGVQDLAELRHGSLERCDQLARRVEAATATVVTSESLLGGLGGIVTELATIPAEILAALRSVHQIGACYGYPLDGAADKALVLAIIGLSQIAEPSERLLWSDRIGALEGEKSAEDDLGSVETALEADYRHEVEDEVVEGLGTSLLEQKLGESIPLLGPAVGVVLDNETVRRVEETARHVFQERWLRENGKVDRIAPKTDPRTFGKKLGDGINRAVYSSGYAVSYGVVFPAALLAEGGRRLLPEPAIRGFEDGALAASRAVDERRAVSRVGDGAATAIGQAYNAPAVATP